jgi:hypothetical protein
VVLAKASGSAVVGQSGIDTRKGLAVNALLAAIVELISRLFATVLRNLVAVSISPVASEDAITTSLLVGRIAVAIRQSSHVSLSLVDVRIRVVNEESAVLLEAAIHRHGPVRIVDTIGHVLARTTEGIQTN